MKRHAWPPAIAITLLAACPRLDILEAKIDRWIERQGKAGSQSTH